MSACTCTLYGHCAVCQPQREAEHAKTLAASTASSVDADNRRSASDVGAASSDRDRGCGAPPVPVGDHSGEVR